MPKLTALVEMEYPSGTTRHPGEAFTCDERHVRVLVAIGKASRGGSSKAEEVKPKEVETADKDVSEVSDKSMSADIDDSGDDSKDDSGEKSKKYNTRAMKSDKG